MTKVKPKKLLKKHRKIAIRTLTALPIVAGGALAITAIFMPGANPISPEKDSVMSDEFGVATFVFDFKETPDNNATDVKILTDYEGIEPTFYDSGANKTFDVIEGKVTIPFVQEQAVPQKGTTTFGLTFMYEVAGQSKTIEVKNLKIEWNVAEHTIEIRYDGNPITITQKARTEGSQLIDGDEFDGFKVILDPNTEGERDVTEYADFVASFNGAETSHVWINKAEKTICWDGNLDPCNDTCEINAKIEGYDLFTATPIYVTFDLYGANISGGSTNLTTVEATKDGIDKTAWALMLNDGNPVPSSEFTPEYTLNAVTPLTGPINVNPDTGLVSWVAEDGTIPDAGEYTFTVTGKTTYKSLEFEATSNTITLVIPTVKATAIKTPIDAISGEKEEEGVDLNVELKLNGTILKGSQLKYEISYTDEPSKLFHVTKDGKLTWDTLPSQETLPSETLEIKVSYGIYSAPIKVVVNNNTVAVTGGSTKLDWGNKEDTKNWDLKVNGVHQDCHFSVVDPESKAPITDWITVTNNGKVQWFAGLLTPGNSIKVCVAAYVSAGSYYSGWHYSEPIEIVRQADPTLSGPTEATVTVGTPGKTEQPFVLSKIEGVTKTPTLSIVQQKDHVWLDEQGYLNWDENLDVSESPLKLTIRGTAGYYTDEQEIKLTFVDKPSIVADATSFEGLGTVGQEYGQFNFMVDGQICRDSALTFTLDSYSSTYWEMIKKGEGDNSYWVLKIKSYAAAEVFTITMTADDQKGHTATLDVTITTFVLNVESPKICRDNSSGFTYECKAQILDGDKHEYIDPTKATWSISKTIDGLSIGEHTGILTITSGSSIHLTPSDIDTYLVVKYTHKNVEITSSRTFDIHFDNANVAGGTSSITLDEEGNFTDDNAWSLKLGSTYEIDDSTIELIDVSDSLKNKITITDGKVSISGGAAGTFKVKGTSDTGVEATSDVIEVKETQKVYEIHMSKKRGYGIANGVGSLAEELYVTCNGEIVEDPNINWEIMDPTTQNCLIITPVGKKATLSWNIPKSATQGDFCTCHIRAHVLSGWSVTTLDTFTLQVVDPSSVIQLHESSLTPTVNAGEAGEFVIEFKYKEGVAGLEPIDLGLDENSKSLGLNIAYEHTDDWETLKISYTEISFSDEGEKYIGTAWIKFNYYGSIIRYDIPFTVTITH